MWKFVALWGILVLLVLSMVGFGGWLFTLPPATAVAEAPPVPREEAEATVAALKPPKRERPLVAVIGINDATETTDYIVPYGVLKRAGVADVVALATGPGPVKLYPALSVEPDATITDFDAQHPEGADYVIVPNMDPQDDLVALEWIRSQAEKGAIVIGVCGGAVIAGNAGILDGKRATTHWFFVKRLRELNPTANYVADRRLVVDEGVATTTGITASIPMMLTLIEAIAGREEATEVARELGVSDWDARHASAAFRFNRPFAMTVLSNVLAFWKKDTLGIRVSPGIDEVSLALVADAWSRTYRSRAVTFADGSKPVETRSGLRVIPDHGKWESEPVLPDLETMPSMQALTRALETIEARYGAGTAEVVRMELEFPKQGCGNERSTTLRSVRSPHRPISSWNQGRSGGTGWASCSKNSPMHVKGG